MKTTLKTRNLGFFVVALIVCLARPARAIEVNGRLGGTITEAQTGAPIPGATVSVSSKALIGGPRQVTTDENGRYSLTELPPGSYAVEVSYNQLKPVRHQVVIRQGELLPLDVAWSAELAETEVTVVKEERHLTKPDSTQSGTVITNEQTSRVPIVRQYQSVALAVAGAVDVNGGGNPQVKGANLQGNHYMIDGLDVTDPVTQTFAANINFDSISSVDVITGGMEAQYNALGGIINVITEGGGDEWHIDSSVYVNNSKFSSQGQFGSTALDGVAPLSQVPPAPTQSYQANLNVGGPIIQHKLWFHTSLEYDYTEASTPAGPPLNLQIPNRRYNGLEARLKLTWAPNERHRVTLSASADPASLDNLDRNNNRLPLAQTHADQGGFFTTALWTFFISPKVTSTVQAGFMNNNLAVAPQGYLGSIEDNGGAAMYSDRNKTYNFNQPQHVNQDDGTVWYQGRSTVDRDHRYRFQFEPSVSIRGDLAGSHDIKIGFQGAYKLENRSITYTGGGAVYTDAGGGPLEAGLCNDEMSGKGCFFKTVSENWKVNVHSISGGLYAQDRWKPLSRLTVVPGVRLDYGVTTNSAGQTTSRLFGVGPRLGVIVDPMGDKKTTVYAFYGRANEVENLEAAGNTSPIGKSDTFQYNPMTMKFDQLISSSGGAGGYRIGTDLKTPHTDEISVGIRREIFNNSLASIEYTYKRIANLWDSLEVNTLWDPTGTRQLTDASGKPIYVDPTKPQQIFLVTTNHPAIRTYQGVDFIIESRPTPNWDLYASYTLSWLYGSSADEFNGQINGTLGPYYNPRQTFLYHGFLPEDLRHVLRIRPSYTMGGLVLGGTMSYSTGANDNRFFFEYAPDGGYVNLHTPIGTEPNARRLNDPRGFSEFRTPDLVSFNLRAAYDFGALLRQGHHLFLIADIFNLLNVRAPTSVENRDVDTFGAVVGRQAPFRVQLALRYMH